MRSAFNVQQGWLLKRFSDVPAKQISHGKIVRKSCGYRHAACMPLPLTTRRGDTLWYDVDRGAVRVLDRRRYPREHLFVSCTTVEEVAHAIEAMIVQGGPPLAYVGGYGLAIAA